MNVTLPKYFSISDLAEYVAEHGHKIVPGDSDDNYLVVPIEKNTNDTIDYSMQEAARLIGIGRKRLYSAMRGLNLLDASDAPYQRYVEQGYLKTKLTNWTHPTTQQLRVRAKPMITAKGILWLKRKIEQQHAA